MSLSTHVRLRSAALAMAAAILAGCTGAPGAPSGASNSSSAMSLTVHNCGQKVDVTHAPQRLVTLNQGATEVALALGLQKRMAGTAYLDDRIDSRYKSAYDQVTVLSAKYPTKEQFLAAKPDFAYAAYSSAFTDKAVGTRQELAQASIPTYISPFGCPKGSPQAAASFDSVWGEVNDIAKVFGVESRAQTLIDEQKSQLAKVKQQAAGKGLRVFWYDSGDKTPFVGAGGGGPQLLVDQVGATNIYASVTSSGWTDGSWEKIVAAQPDVIVFADASWDTAKHKQDYLASDPTLSKMKAVQQKQYVVLPFSWTTPGLHLADGATSLSKQLTELPEK